MQILRPPKLVELKVSQQLNSPRSFRALGELTRWIFSGRQTATGPFSGRLLKGIISTKHQAQDHLLLSGFCTTSLQEISLRNGVKIFTRSTLPSRKKCSFWNRKNFQNTKTKFASSALLFEKNSFLLIHLKTNKIILHIFS